MKLLALIFALSLNPAMAETHSAPPSLFRSMRVEQTTGIVLVSVISAVGDRNFYETIWVYPEELKSKEPIPVRRVATSQTYDVVLPPKKKGGPNRTLQLASRIPRGGKMYVGIKAQREEAYECFTNFDYFVFDDVSQAVLEGPNAKAFIARIEEAVRPEGAIANAAYTPIDFASVLIRLEAERLEALRKQSCSEDVAQAKDQAP